MSTIRRGTGRDSNYLSVRTDDGTRLGVELDATGKPCTIYALTPCCAATGKGSDVESGVVCRKCYREVDAVYGMVGEWGKRTKVGEYYLSLTPAAMVEHAMAARGTADLLTGGAVVSAIEAKAGAVTTQTDLLTVADLDALLQDPRWGGYGYLGERNAFFATYGMSAVKQIEAADRFVLTRANGHRWDEAQLARWVNSKDGRWCGEVLFGSVSPTFTGALPEGAVARAARYI